MSGEKRPYSVIWSAAVFVILEIAAILMLSRTSSLQDIWISRASHRVHASIWGGGEKIRNYFTLGQLNKTLAQENFELSSMVREYSERDLSYRENHLYDSNVGNFRLVPASIVKASRNSQHNYIVLNKGSEDGIKPQTGIITTNGIVGVVNAVGKRYSYGLTLMNAKVNVSARIGKTGLVGALEWDGRHSNGALMKGLPLHYTVAPGDTVWTSGFSTVFPPDIPIGITGRIRQVDGSTNEVSVELFQDFSALRYVIITENLDRGEIAEIEKEGQK
ncbi:MAG: rod shape-determining protein MreC [Bacteroidales bacterium]|nr:rod shape-determining protein MreC [Bacteroidales bacterium]